MNSAKISATPSGSSAGQPTAAKLGCITISVPMKPTIQAPRRRGPHLLLQNEPAKEQHDEGHDEGNRDRLGQRQVAQGGEHHPDAPDLQHRPQRGQPDDAGAGKDRGPPRHGKRQEQPGLRDEPHEDELQQREILAQQFRQRVREGDQARRIPASRGCREAGGRRGVGQTATVMPPFCLCPRRLSRGACPRALARTSARSDDASTSSMPSSARCDTVLAR